jgi:hypothetical protein
VDPEQGRNEDHEPFGLTRVASERQDLGGLCLALPAEYGNSQPVEGRSSPLERRRSLVCSVYLIGVQVIENPLTRQCWCGAILVQGG